jgi:hypothetical protein
MTPLSELAKNAVRWNDRPWEFGKEQFGTVYDGAQMQFWKDFADPTLPRVGLMGATGTGKTRIEAEAVLWFMCVKGGSDPWDHPKGVATAIDGKNLDMNLWPELSKLIQSSTLMSTILKWQTEKIFMKHAPSSWFFEKRTWDAKSSSDPNSPTGALGLAGHHSKNSLSLIDESSGVPMSVLYALERTLSVPHPGGFIKVLQAGNPTHKSGPLYAAATKLKKLWNGGRGPIRMTGDPDDPNRCPRIDIEWAREMIKALGRDDPFVQVYILGDFPSQDFNAFLGIDDVERAMNLELPWNAYCEWMPYCGLDVAYEGNDSTWLTERQGKMCFPQSKIEVPLSDPQIGFNQAARIHPKMVERKTRHLFCDATGGYANAVMEAMRPRGIQPVGAKMNQKAQNDFFKNVRTELYWKGSQWVKNGGKLPPDELLKEEAIATRYIIKNDKMEAESKDIVKLRLGRSPDRWESFLMTFLFDDRPNEEYVGTVGGGQMKSCMDIDALAEYHKPKQPMGRDGQSIFEKVFGGFR